MGTTRFGIYFFRVRIASRAASIHSKETSVTTFKVKVRHIADEWNTERKQKQLRLGFFNRKLVTRDTPGKFRHIFGSLVVSQGVNVWTLKIKKRSANRDHLSAMIGVINMNNRNNGGRLRTLNQCFSHIGIGYGLFTGNGDAYHTKNPRAYGKEVHPGDVVQIMCDYRGQTISFIVNNISWGIAFEARHFPAGKMPHLGLAVALRGCDELQLVDFVTEAHSLFPADAQGRARGKGKSKKLKLEKKGDRYGQIKLENKKSRSSGRDLGLTIMIPGADGAL